MFVHERIAVTPGAFTLVYPKWIPGEHGPTGPLNDLAALRISANGNALDWRRDPVDLYAFHVNVPVGVQTLDVDFDVLLNAPRRHDVVALGRHRELESRPAVSRRRELAQLFREAVDRAARRLGLCYARCATERRPPTASIFATISLEMLVDSPLDLGRYVKKWDLWKDGAAFVQLDAFADSPQDLEIPESLLKAYERVPAEAFAMYGSRHFIDYHALLALSDEIGFQGHRASPIQRQSRPERFLDRTFRIAGFGATSSRTSFRTPGTANTAGRPI